MVDQAVEVSEDLADDGSRYGELPSLKERCKSEISSLGHLGSVTNALHGDLHYNLSKSLLKKNVNGPLGRRKAGVGRVGSGRRVVERMQRGRREELEELRSKGMVKLRLAEPGARDRALRMFSKLRKHGRRPSSKGKKLNCGSLGRKRGGVVGEGVEERRKQSRVIVTEFQDNEQMARMVRQQSLALVEKLFSVPSKEQRVLQRLNSQQLQLIGAAELRKSRTSRERLFSSPEFGRRGGRWEEEREGDGGGGAVPSRSHSDSSTPVPPSPCNAVGKRGGGRGENRAVANGLVSACVQKSNGSVSMQNTGREGEGEGEGRQVVEVVGGGLSAHSSTGEVLHSVEIQPQAKTPSLMASISFPSPPGHQHRQEGEGPISPVPSSPRTLGHDDGADSAFGSQDLFEEDAYFSGSGAMGGSSPSPLHRSHSLPHLPSLFRGGGVAPEGRGSIFQQTFDSAMLSVRTCPPHPHGDQHNPFKAEFRDAMDALSSSSSSESVRAKPSSVGPGPAPQLDSQESGGSSELLPRQLNRPGFAEYAATLGRKPTKADYITNRIAVIGDEIDSQYSSQLESALNSLFDEVSSKSLTYESFCQAATHLLLEGKKMGDGVFMLMCFGRRLLELVPGMHDVISSYTTQVLERYALPLVVESKGWVSAVC